MDVVAIVVLVVLLLVALLALGGRVAVARRERISRPDFESHLHEVNRQLASAVAADHGWRRDHLDACARQAFSERRPSAEIDSLELVQVIDPPGTEDDKAVFAVASGGAHHRLTLGRRGGEWVFENLEG